MAKRSIAELATGAAVLVVTGGFLVFAVANNGRAQLGGMTLNAQFENVGSITPGADVRLSGVKIGSVASVKVNPQTYQAVVTFTVPTDLKLPTDSSAVISSGGLLGGSSLSLNPGGAEALLKNGQTMTITQSAVNLEDLLGKFIFNVGNLADASQRMLQQGEQARGAQQTQPRSDPAPARTEGGRSDSPRNSPRENGSRR